MGTSTTSGYCTHCEAQSRIQKQTLGCGAHGLHFMATFMTAGFWAPAWIVHTLVRINAPYKCATCGLDVAPGGARQPLTVNALGSFHDAKASEYALREADPYYAVATLEKDIAEASAILANPMSNAARRQQAQLILKWAPVELAKYRRILAEEAKSLTLTQTREKFAPCEFCGATLRSKNGACTGCGAA